MKKKILGILNLTPDSFYDGGSLEDPLLKAKRLIKEGADILDIGGESTRPNAKQVSADQELHRILPVIQELKNYPLSIDTYKPLVARKALECGACYLNDITGFTNPEMIAIAKDFEVKIFVMHMQGVPATMQINPIYPSGVVEEIYRWFEKRIEQLMKARIRKENIYLDPGIGFGKTQKDNFNIIKNLQRFKSLGFKLLVGISRKSFLGTPPSDLLPATLAMNTITLLAGADMIRVHDVKEHRQIMEMLDLFYR